MTKARQIYASSNGDRWSLIRTTAGEICVRHEANAASGGHVADIALGTFLASGKGPEQQELLRLIGTLLGPDEAEASTPPPSR